MKATCYALTCGQCGRCIGQRLVTAADRAEAVDIVQALAASVRDERDALALLMGDHAGRLHDDLVQRLDGLLRRADTWLEKVAAVKVQAKRPPDHWLEISLSPPPAAQSPAFAAYAD